jgi:hypothetical protein
MKQERTSPLAACQSEAGRVPMPGCFRQNRTELAAWELGFAHPLGSLC